MTAAQLQGIKQVLNAVLETITDCADGVPAGTLYAALMAQGCSLETFEKIMGILVEAGRVRKDGQLYRAEMVR